MSQKSWIDFAKIRELVCMEDLLQHYGFLDQMTRSGEQLSGFCPLPCHTGQRKKSRSFSVNTAKNVWKCFSCRKGGDIFTLAQIMENLASARDAALRIVSLFPPAASAVSEPSPSDKPTPPQKTPRQRQTESREPSEAPANPPLTFVLKNLDAAHPYMEQRGLTPEAIQQFGVGFCRRGIMKGRIVIPIHDAQGRLIAYAGRAISPEAEKEGKYKLPAGFRKELELFNLHRAQEAGNPLIVVEGFFGVMRLWQSGYANAAALMGSSLSECQQRRLVESASPPGRIILLFDGDPAGRACREDALQRLAPHCFVKALELADGQQPDSLSPDELRALLGSPLPFPAPRKE